MALITLASDGTRKVAHSLVPESEDGSIDGSLRAAQAEVVEQEVFSFLINEASNLSSASTEVSERLIIIDAAQAIELRFELVRLRLHVHSSPFVFASHPLNPRSTETLTRKSLALT